MTGEKTELTLKLATMPDGTPEIFKSIQGEGVKCGALSLFVRFSECNLFCSWCDTPYTWRWNNSHPHDDDNVFNRKEAQIKLTIEQLTSLIRREKINRIIFTGGEPLLQQKRIILVMRNLQNRNNGKFFEFEFETNGTVKPTNEILSEASLFVVSPKLTNSGIEMSKTILHALDIFTKTPKAIFKFVVSSKKDFLEIRQIQQRYNIASKKIWIMPCGRTSKKVLKTAREIVNQIIEYEYNYSPRLHIDLFGDKQGT